jgi:ABC-type Zn uptake system ZnuABC Zn-binding protein ZnuA
VSVVATTVQISALAREVGGDLIDLHPLLSAGADPHAFEPTASDLAAIEDAEVILRNGVGLDDWLDDTISAGDAEMITVTERVPLRSLGDDGEQVDDPHVWQDPANARLMAASIAAALIEADTANRAAYEANLASYGETLEETRAEAQAIIDEIPPENRKMVTDHDAFGYFADAFGLEIVGAVFPVLSNEGEPSAEELADLLDTIEREGVKAIFAEESVNSQTAESLADDAGITIVDDLYGDSLGDEGSGAETIHGMLLANARRIADALK